MILEISKKYLREFYNGDLKAAILKKDGILWTNEKIKAAFNNGNGYIKDLKRYMNDNKIYCYFVEV